MKFLIQLTILLLVAIISLVSMYTFYNLQGTLLLLANDRTNIISTDGMPEDSHRKPTSRIAIISSFVGGPQAGRANLAPHELNLLLNKACYAKLWNYDFIVNTTYGFDKQRDEVEGGAWWLEYGTWNRVPHIRDRLEEYDWILYADIDYIINDMSRPIESFFKEWDLYGKHPSVLLPKDFLDNAKYFSAFAVLIKNDDFGKRLVENWMTAARGLCPKGNFAAAKREYTWEDSDQPGLWYALVKTYREFFPSNFTDSMSTKPLCHPTTGIIDTEYAYAYELDHILGPNIVGSGGSDLIPVPSNQPIIWSLPNNESNGGLGWQLKWGGNPRDQQRYSFAFHLDVVEEWNPHARETLDMCKNVYRCYANVTENGVLQMGCGDRSSIIA